MLTPHSLIAHYRVLSRLGAGGMGEVYLAEDTRLGRKAALKLLPAEFTTNAERRRRFEQEARAASALNHPNIITIYEIGVAEIESITAHFIAAEFIEGQTLRQIVSISPVKPLDALGLAIQVAGALVAAHEAGIVHRDIKPENVMVRPDGLVKVLDFGLARFAERASTTSDPEASTAIQFKTEAGVVMGTVSYMSPEQARGQAVDARTDIFSFGVTLYEMLTGRAPFSGPSLADILAAILHSEPPPLVQFAPGVPVELQRIVSKALHKDRAMRYQTANELLSDLKTLKEDLEFAAREQRTSQAGEQTAAVERPGVRYARSGDIHIAYQVFGQGPLDVVIAPGFVSHLEHFWEEPSVARFLQRIASLGRVIIFDKRGTGLSDRVAEVGTLEQRMDDVRAVMDAAGSQRAVLLGASEGGPMCTLFAATWPERSLALILYGTWASIIQAPDYPWRPSREKWLAGLETFAQSITQTWGHEVDSWWFGLKLFAPSRLSDERFKQWWAALQRRGASPGAALTLIRLYAEIDIRPILPTIRVPTLVIHRTEDRVTKIEEGRYIAGHISGAKLVELPGGDHLPYVGDQEAIIAAIREFLAEVQLAAEADRVLATVLCVQLKAPVTAEGREQWKQFQAQIHGTVERYRGREIETTDTQFLASFDGPARAIRAAYAINAAARQDRLETHIGLHTGECDVAGEKLGGLAVRLSTQVASHAVTGEVLVSNTVKDLVAGSGLQFEERGTQSLQGIEGEWRLFAVK